MYVGNLSPSTTKQDVFDHFKSVYPNIVEAKIITDPVTKASKGFGFVQFPSSEEAQAALGELQGSLINGQAIKLSHGFANGRPLHRQVPTRQVVSLMHVIC